MSKRKMKDSGVEWLGEIPAEWDLVPARNLFSEVKDKNIDGKVTRQFSFRYGKIVDKDKSGRSDVTTDETITAYRIVTPDTIMINGLNLNYDFISQRVAIVEERGIITSAYLALCPNKKLIEPAFAVYLFKGYDSKQVFHGHGSGIRKTLNYSDFKEIKTVCPDLSTQRKIAAYLDVRCAKIDAMIGDVKKAIEEYKAWKASVIFEAVTGKCKIENGECKIGGWAMRESGVEWIGMIPEGWRVNRVKRIVRVENGSDPLTEGSIPVYGSGESSFKTCGEFKEGPTVLLGRKGATLHIPHYIEGRYWNVDTAFDVRMKGNDNLRWFYYLAISFDYKAYISKTTLPSMTQSNYNNMHVPHPPVTEQCAIAAFLDKKCAAIDRVIAEKESLIADLESYKKSLIFECVTGKMEVA